MFTYFILVESSMDCCWTDNSD